MTERVYVDDGAETYTDDVGNEYFDGHYDLASDAAAFSLSGQAVEILAARRLVVATGLFSFTGQAAGLIRLYDALGAEAVAFALSGQDVAFLRALRLNGEAGAFAFSGQAAGLIRAYADLAAGAGSFSVGGKDAALIVRDFLFEVITAGASANASGTVITPALDLSLVDAMSGDGIGLASSASITPANDTDLADSMTAAGIGSINSDNITRH